MNLDFVSTAKVFIGAIFFCSSIHLSQAQLLITPEAACKAIFPKSTELKKISLLLTGAEKEQAQKFAEAPIVDNIFTFFEVKQGDKIIGHAGLHSTKVRTKDQTALVAIDPKGVVVAVEIIAFYEHPEYLPPKDWIKVFANQPLGSTLKSGHDIPIITGSTMTTEKLAQAARIIRGIWQVKFQKTKSGG